MAEDLFASSDSACSAATLRHAKRFELPEALPLERGGELSHVGLVYETWGELSPERDNAVLVCHALSGDSHAASHDSADDPGWWEIAVGQGKPIDTDRFFVICSNVLGGCRGSTGPDSRHPVTGERYGADFPTITVGDMVEAQLKLVRHLGIEKLHSVVGGSLGGHQSLAWAARHPERLASVMALATSPRLTAQAIAFDVVGRNAILRDPNYEAGRYGETDRRPLVGLALARMLGHITYLSQDAMTAKFKPGPLPPREAASEFERKFSVGSYLAHQGERFVERFDANSYMTLSMAMDLFDLGDDGRALARSLAEADCRWLVISFSSDWLFPPFQSRELVEALVPMRRKVTYCEVDTQCGHDAFLLEDELPIYGELMRGFLDPEQEHDPGLDRRQPTSLFRPNRLDYEQILDLIPERASVLDLGCGSGELLHRLRERGHEQSMGVEISETAIVDCTRRGLCVIHGDIDRGLGAFADQQFDVVVLSQTLQAVSDVEGVLREMLRVGRQGIVSFPNAGHESHRKRLAEQGRVPQSTILDAHRWYDAPALRLFSILDFDDLCKEMGLDVRARIGLDSRARRPVEREIERMADLAIFVFGRAS